MPKGYCGRCHKYTEVLDLHEKNINPSCAECGLIYDLGRSLPTPRPPDVVKSGEGKSNISGKRSVKSSTPQRSPFGGRSARK